MNSAAVAGRKATPIVEAEKLPGEVITFYSYKGGTGRTMALANVACLLARNFPDEKVLMIDWDLEAPGLHEYFPPPGVGPLFPIGRNNRTEEGGPPGLIDFLISADLLSRSRRSMPSEEGSLVPGSPDVQGQPSAAAAMDSDADIVQSILEELAPEKLARPTREPNLMLLRAGTLSKGYAQAVNSFEWEAFHRRMPFFFQMLAERLATKFRYVLIDSRTGVTDSSGICSAIMPEKLVVVFTPNQQSLTGVRHLICDALAYRREHSDDVRPLMVFPLPSRIDTAREKLEKQWRFGAPSEGIEGYQPIFEALLAESYTPEAAQMGPYFDEVKIQQSGDYAYGEEIAVTEEGDGSTDRFSLARSYETFANRLIGRAAPWAEPKQDEDGGTAITLVKPSKWWRLKQWWRSHVRAVTVFALAVMTTTVATGWWITRTDYRRAESELQKLGKHLRGTSERAAVVEERLKRESAITKAQAMEATEVKAKLELAQDDAKRAMAEAEKAKREANDYAAEMRKLSAQLTEQEGLALATTERNPETVPAGSTPKQVGYIWLGTWTGTEWSAVNLADAQGGLKITQGPESIRPGETYQVRAKMALRDGLPEESSDYYRARRAIGAVPEGNPILIEESPQTVRRLGRSQIWVKVQILAKGSAPNKNARPRLYVTAGPNSTDLVKRITPMLESRGFEVNIKTHATSPTDAPKVLFYSQYPEDSEKAEKLINALKQMGVENVQPEIGKISGSSSARPGHLDVMLP